MTIELFPFQVKILKAPTPLIISICGRSAGKSYASSYWIFKKLLECEGMGLVTAPTYQQAEIPIKYLMSICESHNIPYCFNKIPSFAKSSLPSHNNIFSCLLNNKLKQLKMASADVEDNLRSGSYSWCLIDEACYVSEQAWNIIAPTLRGRGTDFIYQTLMISSPAGKNWLYTSFMTEENPQITIIKAPSTENFKQVDDLKISLWKETMSDRMFNQEILGLIIDSNLNAIFYAYRSDIVQPIEGIPSLKYIVGLDQNVSPGVGVICQTKDKVWNILDEIHIDDGANYESYIREITKKVPPKSTIEICGDSSGNARNVASLQTFYNSVISGLKSKGYTVYDKTNRSNPKVYESREEVNRLMERGLIKISPKCSHLIQDFEQATWKSTAIFETDKKKYDPHTAEALVYAIWEHRTGTGPRNINL